MLEAERMTVIKAALSENNCDTFGHRNLTCDFSAHFTPALRHTSPLGTELKHFIL